MPQWMSCSARRTDIAFGARHWVCSVSTCNRARTRLVFCTVGCWDSHLSVLRHREAWAVEATAPTQAEWQAEEASQSAPEPAPVRRVVAPAPVSAPAATGQADETDILVVMSKLKKYIRDRSGMNTSDGVASVLSDHLRAICDLAIRTAGAEGRKTVLDRDVPPIRR